MTHGFKIARQRMTNHGGTQVSGMERFGDVRWAKLNDDSLAFFDWLQSSASRVLVAVQVTVEAVAGLLVKHSRQHRLNWPTTVFVQEITYFIIDMRWEIQTMIMLRG